MLSFVRTPSSPTAIHEYVCISKPVFHCRNQLSGNRFLPECFVFSSFKMSLGKLYFIHGNKRLGNTTSAPFRLAISENDDVDKYSIPTAPTGTINISRRRYTHSYRSWSMTREWTATGGSRPGDKYVKIYGHFPPIWCHTRRRRGRLRPVLGIVSSSSTQNRENKSQLSGSRFSGM